MGFFLYKYVIIIMCTVHCALCTGSISDMKLFSLLFRHLVFTRTMNCTIQKFQFEDFFSIVLQHQVVLLFVLSTYFLILSSFSLLVKLTNEYRMNMVKCDWCFIAEYGYGRLYSVSMATAMCGTAKGLVLNRETETGQEKKLWISPKWMTWNLYHPTTNSVETKRKHFNEFSEQNCKPKCLVLEKWIFVKKKSNGPNVFQKFV